jgi:hypothetical protein
MVQRHIRVRPFTLFCALISLLLIPQYEGEKDTRGPADFSGNAAKHLDDAGDGDDDDADDDDGDSGIRGPHKRRGDGRMKQPPPLTVGGPADVRVYCLSLSKVYPVLTYIFDRWVILASQCLLCLCLVSNPPVAHLASLSLATAKSCTAGHPPWAKTNVPASNHRATVVPLLTIPPAVPADQGVQPTLALHPRATVINNPITPVPSTTSMEVTLSVRKLHHLPLLSLSNKNTLREGQRPRLLLGAADLPLPVVVQAEAQAEREVDIMAHVNSNTILVYTRPALSATRIKRSSTAMDPAGVGATCIPSFNSKRTAVSDRQQSLKVNHLG